MQCIRTEYRRGVLFIRLKGGSYKDDYLEDIKGIIEYFGIKYVVLNITNIRSVSLDNISHIIRYNNRILKKKKHLLICDSNKRWNKLFKNIIPNIEREIDAFSLI